jgi:hypothetical protein
MLHQAILTYRVELREPL